jgi:hypothetical protein
METISNELIRNCVFGIKCDKDWKSMEHVRQDENDNEVRFCSGCEKEVFETITSYELYQNVRLNRCVAIIQEQLSTVGDIVFVPEDLEEEKS